MVGVCYLLTFYGALINFLSGVFSETLVLVSADSELTVDTLQMQSTISQTHNQYEKHRCFICFLMLYRLNASMLVNVCFKKELSHFLLRQKEVFISSGFPEAACSP